MLGVSVKPVMGFVARHGQEMILHRPSAAHPVRPWESDDASPRNPATIKGLIGNVRPADNVEATARASFRSVAVLLVGRREIHPQPGDMLEGGGQKWRVENILPLARHRAAQLLEAQLISVGGGTQ